MKILALVLTSLYLLFSSCGVPQEEYDQLKTDYESLKLELEEIKYGPERLLNESKNLFNNKDYEKVKIKIAQLLEKHPTSTEAEEGKALLVKSEKEIEKAEAAEKSRLANATKKMRKSYDDMNDVTWYRDKSSPKYVNRNGFFAYIGQKTGSPPWMQFSIQYAADDWLFIEKFTINVDGTNYIITENQYGEIETDNGSGGIWEWLDRRVKNKELEILKAVANGKNVKVRYHGQQYHKDKRISSTQKLAIKNTLAAFEALGGEIN